MRILWRCLRQGEDGMREDREATASLRVWDAYACIAFACNAAPAAADFCAVYKKRTPYHMVRSVFMLFFVFVAEKTVARNDLFDIGAEEKQETQQ